MPIAAAIFGFLILFGLVFSIDDNEDEEPPTSV